MRQKLIYALVLVAALLLARDLYVILLQFPDEVQQGPIFRIIFFHVPVAWTAFLCFLLRDDRQCHIPGDEEPALRCLRRLGHRGRAGFRRGQSAHRHDLGRIIWGIWWTWDARLTSMLVGWLIYAGYIMLRRAIEEPSERAKMAAVLSIFAFADVPIIFFSIKWWRTQHPQPVVWGGGSMDPAYLRMMFVNWIPMLLLAAAMLFVRMRQEQDEREIDALRREVHAF